MLRFPPLSYLLRVAIALPLSSSRNPRTPLSPAPPFYAYPLASGPPQHVPSLYSSIRHRALCQYVQPFSSVDLHAMATAFNTPVG